MQPQGAIPPHTVLPDPWDSIRATETCTYAVTIQQTVLLDAGRSYVSGTMA